MITRFTYEQFMNALLDCIQYSKGILSEDTDIFLEASCVEMKKLPEELREAFGRILDKSLNEAVEDEATLEEVENCVSNIIAGKAPEEVVELMKKYHEAARKMFEADFEYKNIEKNKAQFELECLEGDLLEQGYIIVGGYEAYCNLFNENFDPDDFI